MTTTEAMQALVQPGLANAHLIRLQHTIRETAVSCSEPLVLLRTGTQGSQLVYHQLDISKPDSVAAFAEWLKQKYGKLDILVNNAGKMPLCGTVPM